MFLGPLFIVGLFLTSWNKNSPLHLGLQGCLLMHFRKVHGDERVGEWECILRIRIPNLFLGLFQLGLLFQIQLDLFFSQSFLLFTFLGSAKQDPDKVAAAIIDAIEDFIQKGLVQSMKKVKVVIFLPQVLDVFYANMKKREGSQPSPQQPMMSKISCELFIFMKYMFLILMSHEK